MRDLIDERNKKEKIKSSIIKRWNVNYTEAELIGRQSEEQEDCGNTVTVTAGGTEELSSLQYNPTTGSYSGAYGKGKVDDVTKGQIDLILKEKEAMIRSLIEKGQQ